MHTSTREISIVEMHAQTNSTNDGPGHAVGLVRLHQYKIRYNIYHVKAVEQPKISSPKSFQFITKEDNESMLYVRLLT